jgi:hypothetical protein
MDNVATHVCWYSYVCELISRNYRMCSSQTPQCRVQSTNYMHQFNDAKLLLGTRESLSQVSGTSIGLHS